MRVEASISVNEVLLLFLENDQNVGDRVVNAVIEIELFGETKNSRSYGVHSWTVLPGEKFKFVKNFIQCTTIKDLLRSLEKESIYLRVWIHQENSNRREILAEYKDNVFQFFYPYVTILSPSYDKLSRHVYFRKRGLPPVNMELTLSMDISDSRPTDSSQRRRSKSQNETRSQSVQTVGNRPFSSMFESPIKPLPKYMRHTFSSMMAKEVTQGKFFMSQSVTDVSKMSDCKLSNGKVWKI